MIWDAEQRSVLKPGMTIIKPISGNTGIGLAYAGAARGFKVKLTMPENMSIEWRKILKAFGAELELTPGDKGMPGAIDLAAKLAAEQPDKYFMPQQFTNPANPSIHYRTTGPEIWNDTEGNVDVLVAGVGTGGTITGILPIFSCGRALQTSISGRVSALPGKRFPIRFSKLLEK
jgi:cysteine synthase A